MTTWSASADFLAFSRGMCNHSAVTYEDLIGKPYRVGAEGPDAYDCYGLVRELHRRWHGIEPPPYPVFQNRFENGEMVDRAISSGCWRKLQRPEPGATLVLSVMGFGAHLGFVVDPARFVHARKDQVCVERLGRAWRIMGAYVYAP